MIHVLATVELQAGTRDRFLDELAAVVPAVRSEPGCLEYGAALDVAAGLEGLQPPVRPDHVTVIEKWTDLTALAAHLAAPHMLAYRERVRTMVRRTSLQVLSALDAGVVPMHPVGYARTPFRATGEVPKGLGAEHVLEGTLEILPQFEAGLTDIEGFSHLFVLWVFDRAAGACELVGTPPTDDRPHGVFATRSPRRPNPIGLTVVRLLGRDGRRLRVGGVDMLDGSPLLDVKPYLSSVPAGELRRGWLAEAEARREERG